MDQKWIQILVILMLFQKNSAGTVRTVQDGERVEIRCTPGEGSMVVWMRVLDGLSVEFIGSFSTGGMVKERGPSYSQLFSYSPNILTLKSFNRARDSGTYSCAALYKGIELKFGETTRLSGEEIKKNPVPVEPTRGTTRKSVTTTTTACRCKDTKKQGLALSCHPIILGALAGGCGLLLLLLITTTVYCNQIRTRRCPHHYKRKLRMAALEKQQQHI